MGVKLTMREGPLLVGVAMREETVLGRMNNLPSWPQVDVLELRLDCFRRRPGATLAAGIRRLQEEGVAVLATVRSAAEGGRARMSEEDREKLLREAVALGCWVDVEGGAPIAGKIAGYAHARGVPLIVSFHDFLGTPEATTLASVLARGRELGARVCKLATHVRDEADSERLRTLLLGADDVAVMGMGPSSKALRIEFARLGSMLSYGYLDEPSAPGQPSARELDEALRTACPGYAARRRKGGLKQDFGMCSGLEEKPQCRQ